MISPSFREYGIGHPGPEPDRRDMRYYLRGTLWQCFLRSVDSPVAEDYSPTVGGLQSRFTRSYLPLPDLPPPARDPGLPWGCLYV